MAGGTYRYVALLVLAAVLAIVWFASGERETATGRAPPDRRAAQPARGEREARSTPDASGPAAQATAPRPALERERTEEATADPSRATLRVLVVTDEDAPCGGAAVALNDYARGKQRVRRTTGPDGRVEIRDLAPGRPQLSVRVASLRRITTVELEAGRVTAATVRLPRGGGVVEGTVSHRGRGPLTDAGLTLIRRTGGRSDYVHGAATDGGRYRIEAVPPGTWTVEVGSGTLGRARRAGKVVIAGSETVRFDIVVGELALHGVVRDAVTRRPIEGVLVRMQDPVSRECTTDSDGVYRFYDVTGGEGRLVLVKEEYELLFVDVGPLDGGEAQARDILLHRGAVLELTVTNEEGRAVRGALRLVIVDLDDPEAPAVTTGVVADAAGFAVYRKIRPGRYELAVRQGAVRSRAQEFDVRAGRNTLHFQLVAEPEIPMLVGTVRDAATRRPVPGVKIHAMSLQKTVVTDERGEFRYLRLTSEEQDLRVSKDGYGFRRVRTERLEKGRTKNIEVELGPGATLELTVRNHEGEPPTDTRLALLFWVQAAPLSVKWSAVVDVDDEGYVAYRCVPPGKYRLMVVSREGSAKLDVDVPAEGTSVKVRLR